MIVSARWRPCDEPRPTGRGNADEATHDDWQPQRAKSGKLGLPRHAQTRGPVSRAVPQRHAKLIEVALRQIRQNSGIDFALAKCGLGVDRHNANCIRARFRQ